MSKRELSSNRYSDSPPTLERKKQWFENWRKSVPFTNDQIADALQAHADAQTNDYLKRRYESNADYVRRGGLTGNLLSKALDRLVKFCGICGKTALYRYASVGRCREHRLVTDQAYRDRVKAKLDGRAERGKDIENHLKTIDGVKAHHAIRGKRRHKGSGG